MIQSLLVRYWTQPGVIEAVPFVIVIVTMIAGGKLIPARGTLSLARLPLAPASRFRPVPALVATAIVVLGLVAARRDLPERDLDLARHGHHRAVGGGRDRVRRPDLADADGVRRHRRLHGLEARRQRRDPVPVADHPRGAVRGPGGRPARPPGRPRPRHQPRGRHARRGGGGERGRVPERQVDRRRQRQPGARPRRSSASPSTRSRTPCASASSP